MKLQRSILRTSMRAVCWLSAMASGLLTVRAEPEPVNHASAKVDFQGQVVPLLVRHCTECHNGFDLKGGLSFATKESLAAGGESGEIIAAGSPDDSLLWQYVEGDEMPPRGEKLSADEKRVLREWIAQGARWEGGPIDPLAYTTDRRAGYDWWSLQPIREVVPPRVRHEERVANEIDRFILAKLEEHDLSPAGEADARTLVRRLYFDVVGLPPPPERVEEFQTELELEYSLQAAWDRLKPELQRRLKPELQPSGAYGRLVDELLESPHYGERWARHWFDVIRFGESQGFERNWLWPNAWRYRDWVICALNDDMPYDEFVRQQIAGDVLSPDDPRGVIATGYLTCGPWDMASAKNGSDIMQRMAREVEMEEQVGTLGQAFLGMTLHCARCHDHKYDPISTRDYYRVVSTLSGVWQGTRETLSDAPAVAAERERAALGRQIVLLREAMAELDGEVRDEALSEAREEAATTLRKLQARREAEQTRLDDQRQKVSEAADEAERIKLQERVTGTARKLRRINIDLHGARDAVERLQRAVSAVPYAAILDRLPVDRRDRYRPLVFQVSRLEMRYDLLAGGSTHAPEPVEPGVVHVLARGDFRRPGEAVAPGGLVAVHGPSSDFGLPPEAPEAVRRRKLAEWIANPRNPLTARVIVNRIWQHHFDRGLVGTANDFGFLGGKPSHAELLDWLAAELIRSGWRLKHIHRLILNSSTYRQCSRASVPRAEEIDADNTLLWRMNPRRLEAEAVRDAVLAVSGELNPQMGGPGYRDFTLTAKGSDDYYPPRHAFNAEVNRRTIYRTWARSASNSLLDTLDCPDPSVTAPRRTVTTTPIQALTMLNGPFLEAAAERFANRLDRHCGRAPEAQVVPAYRLAVGRVPDAIERARAVQFVERLGLPAFCLTLLNVNEFVYID